jgi:hypothetical protein
MVSRDPKKLAIVTALEKTAASLSPSFGDVKALATSAIVSSLVAEVNAALSVYVAVAGKPLFERQLTGELPMTAIGKIERQITTRRSQSRLDGECRLCKSYRPLTLAGRTSAPGQ